jgi:hypothetical protein
MLMFYDLATPPLTAQEKCPHEGVNIDLKGARKTDDT